VRGIEMASRRRCRKGCETFLIREFVGKLGYKVRKPEWVREAPDAKLSLRRNGEEFRVGIEHTAYFCDTEPGKASEGAERYDFWDLVVDSLVRRARGRDFPHHVFLPHVSLRSGISWLPRDHARRRELARQVAADLVVLVKSIALPPGGRCTIRSIPAHLAAASLVVASMLVWMASSDRIANPRFDWRGPGCGGVAVIPGHLAKIIRQKTGKAADYDWSGVVERWLLIVAAGTKGFSDAGGPAHQSPDWGAPELVAACQQSPFDRTYFWERTASWYKQVHPPMELVKYGR
jgi:hypothetical protein